MRMLASFLAALALGSCASFESTPNAESGKDGLAYFLPKKDFLATITIESGKDPTVVFTESPAYPDLERSYLLRYSSNPFGKNVMNLTVNEKGLLSTASSHIASGVSDALIALATSAGDYSAFNKMGGPENRQATEIAGCGLGTHVFLLPAEDTIAGPFCGVEFEIRKLAGAKGARGASQNEEPGNGTESAAGIFYRQGEPYRLIATGPHVDAAAILFSPSHAPVRFLPIQKTFFANNTTTFALTDGMPTTYNVDTDGEAIALLKLPADVIGAYFAAIGSIFDSFGNADKKKADALDAELKLQVERQKYAACIAAVKANNTQLIASLGC